MYQPPTTPTGRRPGIVLLHGVGVGPESFDGLDHLLGAEHRVAVIERASGLDVAPSLEAQADLVADRIIEDDLAGACVVGVSGGATLALVLALRHPDLLGSLVLHEPLVGRLVPALHARFAEAARRAARSEDDALAVVRTVLGEATWSALGADRRTLVGQRARQAQLEVPVFAAFDPSAEDLADLRSLRVLTTVGGLSGPERHAVASVLATLAGAEVAVVDGAGNAVQLDAPAAFAQLIGRWQQACLDTET